MPQFDFFSFFVQIFWLSIFSVIFYLIYLKIPLKNSSQVMKMRIKLKSFIVKSYFGENILYNKSISFLENVKK